MDPEVTYTMINVITDGLGLVKSVITFVTGNPILLTGVVIGIASYGIAVVKNSIR